MSLSANSNFWGLDTDNMDYAHLKWRAKIFSGGTPSRNIEEFWVGGSLPWLGSGAVNQRLVVEPTAFITEEAVLNSSTKLMPSGALIIALAGQGKTKGMVAQLGMDCYGNQSLACIEPVADSSRFLYWWLASKYIQIRGLASNESRDGLNHEMIGIIPIPIISSSIQNQIASYLDRETARIDELVEAKESMLQLLEQKRAALISRAVTRGLDLKAPTKPSCLDWLGEIPKHWRIMRAKGLFHEVDSRTETGEEELLSLRMHVGLVPHHDVSDKELEPKDVIGFKKVKAGQLVINRMRASMGLIAIAPSDGLVSPDYAVFDIVHEIHIPYFLALFNTGLVGALFRSSSKGLGNGSQGFLRLYTENFLAIHFPVPPIEEQESIVRYLDDERTQTGILEADLKKSIELLKERRSALITAAVTGKIPLEEMVV